MVDIKSSIDWTAKTSFFSLKTSLGNKINVLGLHLHRTSCIIPSSYITSDPGPLSLAIPLWVGTITTSDSWDVNRHTPQHTGCICGVLQCKPMSGCELRILVAAYLHRIGRRDSAICPHCHSADETVEHLVFQCPAHDHARRDTWPGDTFTTDPQRPWSYLERIGAVTHPPDQEWERERAVRMKERTSRWVSSREL